MREYLEIVLAGIEEPFPGFANIVKVTTNITDGSVWIWNIVTDVFWVSDNFEVRFGYSDTDLKYDYEWWIEKIHATDSPRVLSELNAILSHGHGSWASEYRFRCVDKQYIHVLTKAVVVSGVDGKPNLMIGSIQDISERRNRQKMLSDSYEHLHNLTRRLHTAREDERSFIARELHDEFAQMLTALKLDLFWLQKNLEDKQENLLTHTNDMCSLVDLIMDRTRELASDLKPRVLDKLGIVAAITWQIEEYEQRTDCCYLLDNCVGNISFPHAVEVAIFRIFQESLTNVVRHAHANNVNIMLKFDDQRNLILKIDDDGIGISQDVVYDSKSIGLTSMRERASSFGGVLSVDSLKKGGTSVRLKVPAQILTEKSCIQNFQ